MSSVMSVIDFVAIMPYYIGLGLDDDNEVHCHASFLATVLDSSAI